MSISGKSYVFKALLNSWPEKAIRFLYAHYYDRLVTIAEVRTGDHDVAKDVAQDTMIDVWRDKDRISRIKQLDIGAYLFVIVRNKCSAHFNNSVKLNERQIEYIEQKLHQNEPTIEQIIISKEEKEMIFRIINSFPEKQRECLKMKFYKGMSNEAIASRLNVTVKAVEQRVTEAYKRFRRDHMDWVKKNLGSSIGLKGRNGNMGEEIEF